MCDHMDPGRVRTSVASQGAAMKEESQHWGFPRLGTRMASVTARQGKEILWSWQGALKFTDRRVQLITWAGDKRGHFVGGCGQHRDCWNCTLGSNLAGILRCLVQVNYHAVHVKTFATGLSVKSCYDHIW